MLVSLMLAVTLQAHQEPAKNPPVIDGDQLRGFEVAVAYLRFYGKNDKPTPFKLENFTVAFEGKFQYHFEPKLAPGEKVQPELFAVYGPSCRVTVDPKRLKVISAVVE